MSEEKTQIFRGEEPPEMAIAETTEIERKKPLDAPVDQRGLHDQKDGASFERSMHDADGLSDLRQLHGKSGGEGAPRLTDAQGPADPKHLHDASLGGHGATMRDGEGPSDQRQMHDADGLSDQRRMEDAQGMSDLRKMDDAEGLSDLREMRDQQAMLPESGVTDEAAQVTDEVAEAAIAEAEQEAAPEVMSDPDLTFKVDDDATPWALSIHLEERLASLGVTTTKVNHQLDRLDESIQRLAKRIAR